MKIYFHRYVHEPLPGKKMSGALLKIHHGAFSVGYADVHPWPEFGEQPLDQQLDCLTRSWFTPLLKKSIFFAKVDSLARRANRNLLVGLDLPSTHSLVRVFHDEDTALALESGFKICKIKILEGSEAESRWLEGLPSNFKLRLDLGGRLDFVTFQTWWSNLSSELRRRIDAVEDPWNDGVMKSIADCPAFGDWLENPAWTGKIIKPSRDDSFDLYSQNCFRRIIFTHSLDHRLGRLAAVWEAARFYRRYPQLKQACGFSGLSAGALLKPASGSGFGLDEELHSLRWERLS